MNAPRRQFLLPSIDAAFLETLGLRWETLMENGQYWLVLHEYVLPPDFIQNCVALAILIQPPYPDGPLDMGYFFPHIQRADGRTIARADFFQQLDDQQWQRWSRHRPGDAPWILGVDDLQSHLEYIRSWLTAEPQRI